MNSKIVSGSIVLYNNDLEILRNAVNSFLNSSLNVFLYLIDNSPTNYLQNHFIDSKIFYYHNPSNPGFGAGHNLAINRSKLDGFTYHVIINPDVFFNSDVITQIRVFLDSHLDVGLLMPKILYPDGRNQYLCKRNATVFDLFLRGFAPKFIQRVFNNRMRRFLYMDEDNEVIKYNVPYLSGCFMFLRISELNKIGGFDERFFMYFEDTDLSFRFYKFSKTCYYPISQVYHHYSGMTHKSHKFKIITIVSLIKYFNKWGWFKYLM